MADAKKQLYLWFGTNDFEIHEKINQWREIFEKKYSAMNVLFFDLKDASKGDLYKDLKNALQVDSLFGSNKLIILKNFLATTAKLDKESQEIILAALEKISDAFFLIFVEIGNPDKRGKIYKKLFDLGKENKAEVREFVLPSEKILGKWITDRSVKYGADIDPEGLNFLISLVGSDLWQLDSEIRKLAHYKFGKKISSADIKLLVKGKYNDDIFALTDAISAKNKAKAIKLFQDQLDTGANEFYLLTMLVRQFRILWQVKEVSAGSFSPDEVAQKLGLHPFVVRKTLPYLKGFTIPQLKEIYKNLLQFEIQMKTRNTNFEALYDLLIAKL